MHKIIIADTSCLIVLSKIGELELLHELYKEVYITPEINIEYNEKLPGWLMVEKVKNNNWQKLLELQLDKGESSAIALAMEAQNSILILDDLKARRIAGRLGLDYTGTIGVIIKAKHKGILHSIKPILNKIKLTDFRITEEIEIEALKEANEN